jgi:MSHA biogenesis protein MshN
MGDLDMSLVNEMLRNLDRRAPCANHSQRSALPPSADEPANAPSRSPLAAVSAALGLAAAIALAWPALQPTPKSVTTGAAPSPLPDVAVAPVAPAAPPPVAQVRHLALAQVEGGTRLEVELSRPTRQRIEPAADGRGVELALEDAELGPALPQLDLRGTPVRAFEAERADGELRIRLATSRPVRATSVMRGGDEDARVDVELRADAPEEAAAAPPAYAAAAPAARAESPKSAGRATSLWRDAVERAARGDERSAEDELHHSLERAPASRGARSALVALLLRAGRIDDAEREIAAGRAQPGEEAAYAALAARARLARGDAEGAAAELEAHPPAVAKDPEHHALLAAVRERLGRHADAAETYTGLLSVDPRRSDWWLGLALAREGEGKPADALGAYRSASRLPGLSSDAARWVAERMAALSRGG